MIASIFTPDGNIVTLASEPRFALGALAAVAALRNGIRK